MEWIVLGAALVLWWEVRKAVANIAIAGTAAERHHREAIEAAGQQLDLLRQIQATLKTEA